MPDATKKVANERAQNALIISDWWRKHGGEGLMNNDSDNYDLKTLKKLALDGDENYIEKVGNLYLQKNNLIEADNFYQEAAVHGSIVAISEMTGMLDRLIF